jgi:hypothetical protein
MRSIAGVDGNAAAISPDGRCLQFAPGALNGPCQVNLDDPEPKAWPIPSDDGLLRQDHLALKANLPLPPGVAVVPGTLVKTRTSARAAPLDGRWSLALSTLEFHRPDPNHGATAQPYATIAVFSAQERGGASVFLALDVLPPPPLLTTPAGPSAVWARDGTVYRWSAGQITSWPLPKDHAADALLALSPDGTRLYTSHSQLRGIFVWDTATGQLIERVMTEAFVAGYRTVIASPCGRWLAAGGPGRGVIVYDLQQPRMRGQLLVPFEPGDPSRFAFNHDGRKLAIHRPAVTAAANAKETELVRVWEWSGD